MATKGYNCTSFTCRINVYNFKNYKMSFLIMYVYINSSYNKLVVITTMSFFLNVIMNEFLYKLALCYN